MLSNPVITYHPDFKNLLSIFLPKIFFNLFLYLYINYIIITTISIHFFECRFWLFCFWLVSSANCKLLRSRLVAECAITTLLSMPLLWSCCGKTGPRSKGRKKWRTQTMGNVRRHDRSGVSVLCVRTAEEPRRRRAPPLARRPQRVANALTVWLTPANSNTIREYTIFHISVKFKTKKAKITREIEVFII